MRVNMTTKFQTPWERAAGARFAASDGSPPSYEYSQQTVMSGERDVVGFGTDAFALRVMEKEKANEIIRANHYSKKTATDAVTRICFGVWMSGKLVGVLQFGYAMNPQSCGSVVAGTKLNGYLELNRMWLNDEAPKNTESKAISFAIKIIKRRMPLVEWIQSFADERCKRLGVVYQAANFGYYGHHVSKFWWFNGEWIHNSIVTNGSRKAKARLESQNIHEKAETVELRQFRYIYWIQKRARKRCLLKEQAYPKHAAEVSMETRPVTNGESEGQFLDAAPISRDAKAENTVLGEDSAKQK